MPRSRRPFHAILYILPLLLVLTQPACGDDTPDPSRDAGVQTSDAGNDAGSDDAGSDDAGSDDAVRRAVDD
ncbi:hypothetical protein ACLEPN_43085, partial [Myxococcus sp. 1LA]